MNSADTLVKLTHFYFQNRSTYREPPPKLYSLQEKLLETAFRQKSVQ